MARTVEDLIQSTLGAQLLTILRLQAELEAAQEKAAIPPAPPPTDPPSQP